MLTLFLTFLLQEPISSSLALARALHLNTAPHTIHILYLTATSIDICAGYITGLYLCKHQNHRNAYRYLKDKLSYIFPENIPFQKNLGLFLLGPIIFPVTAFLTPLLGFSFIQSFFILLSSEIIFWYSSIWGIVLGITSEKGISLLHVVLVAPMLAIMLIRMYVKK
jgi:hypothetical protein